MNALKRAEAADDLPGVVQSAKAILAEFPKTFHKAVLLLFLVEAISRRVGLSRKPTFSRQGVLRLWAEVVQAVFR